MACILPPVDEGLVDEGLVDEGRPLKKGLRELALVSLKHKVPMFCWFLQLSVYLSHVTGIRKTQSRYS